MSPEQQPPQQEAVVEELPSIEDIKAVFADILEGKVGRVLQVRENEKGIYFYEVGVALENGETAVYLFQDDVIYVTFHGSDGKEYYGETVLRYIKGIWLNITVERV